MIAAYYRVEDHKAKYVARVTISESTNMRWEDFTPRITDESRKPATCGRSVAGRRKFSLTFLTEEGT